MGSRDQAFYTVKEAAVYLRIARATAYSWIQSGLIPCYRLGPKPRPGEPDRRVVRIKAEDLEAFVQEGREVGSF
ncbi:helix-turn-helix domain-containing protein [Desulfoferula mesophila]|uniref:Helix-turn-helix domain-containing protein n=1 Tax=Desulfoferula mesophila TaxID=3058419 RepID=A0AAU9EVF6_9BACT|nr:hypothetical protein FAK_15620 [Desulfoferula mesophilus]